MWRRACKVRPSPARWCISETTERLVAPHFELRSLGSHPLKGIARPMELHQVVRSNLTASSSSRGLPESVALVGRENQSRLLRFTWNRLVHDRDNATRPEETVVVVRGVAGIGKSALAAELAAHVHLEGGVVLEANCSPYHGNVALWPVGRMLEQLLGFYPDQPAEDRLTELEQRLDDAGLASDTVPLLTPLLGLTADERWARPEVDALALRQRTLEALVTWLAHTAETTPSLVVAEDLHWADPTTVELLGLLATAAHPRHHDPDHQPGPGRGALGLRGGRHRVGAARGEGGGGAGGGADGGRAGRDAASPDRRAGSRSPPVPPGADPQRRHRTSRRSAPAPHPRDPDGAATGARASIFAWHSWRPPLEGSSTKSRCANSPAVTSTPRCPASRTPRLIERVSEFRLGRYRFRHDLMRDTAYETQVLPIRQKTHRSVAELLAAGATAPGDLAVVAKHWDLAGDVVQSVPAYMAAAQAAQSTASHTEARQLLDRAQELTSTLPEGDDRDLTELMIRAQRTISTSSLYGYGYPDVFEDYRVAEEICRKLSNRPEIMPVQVGIWSYLLVRGSVDSASTVLEPLTDVLDDPATAWFAPEIKSCMGYGAFYQGRLEEAHRWLVEAWEGYGARSAEAASSPFWPLPHDAVPVTAVALACVVGPAGLDRGERTVGAASSRHGGGAGIPFRSLQRGVRLGVPRLDPDDHGQPGRGARVRATHDGDRRAVPLRLLPTTRDAVPSDARA